MDQSYIDSLPKARGKRFYNTETDTVEAIIMCPHCQRHLRTAEYKSITKREVKGTEFYEYNRASKRVRDRYKKVFDIWGDKPNCAGELCLRNAEDFWVDTLGYTLSRLRIHIEEQFKPGMSWANWGPDWHLDHIRPNMDFKTADTSLVDKQIRKSYAWDNLRPMFIVEHHRRSMGAKVWDGSI